MKNKIINRFPAVVLLVCSVVLAEAQLASFNCQAQHMYTATKNGSEVGWLRTSVIENGQEKTWVTESNLTIQMLLSFNARAITSNKYMGNILTRAVVFRTLNGKTKLDNDLQLKEGKYNLVKGKTSQPITKPINYTVTALYFSEPVGISELFSEVYLTFIAVEKIAAHSYQTVLPDGGCMTYSYTNGQLVKITANTSYATVIFQLKQ